MRKEKKATVFSFSDDNTILSTDYEEIPFQSFIAKIYEKADKEGFKPQSLSIFFSTRNSFDNCSCPSYREFYIDGLRIETKQEEKNRMLFEQQMEEIRNKQKERDKEREKLQEEHEKELYLTLKKKYEKKV